MTESLARKKCLLFATLKGASEANLGLCRNKTAENIGDNLALAEVACFLPLLRVTDRLPNQGERFHTISPCLCARAKVPAGASALFRLLMQGGD